MTHAEILAIVNATKKGSIHQIEYVRPVKTRKGVTDIVEKTTSMQGRFNVRYDNMKVVKEGRASGALPETNQGLAPNLEWVDDIFLRNKATGKELLRVSMANGNKPTIVYKKNGVIVDKADIKAICLKAELDEHDSPVKNIGIEKITRIK